MNELNKAILERYTVLVNEQLKKFTESKPNLRESVCEAMEYSLSAGGKRIRPVLMLEFCKMCGEKDAEKYIEIVSTIELIHTYSLIHDDLPCMDNDDYRRGKPSCHKAYKEDIALLAGDALNSLAFEKIANAAISGLISADKAVMLISVLGHAVGTDGMIGGQVIDLESEGKAISLDTLNLLQSCKTGALIEAACVMGVILGGKFEMIPAAADFAQAFGRAFQVEDDILDVNGTFEELGKPIGSDDEQNKSTYVSLLGMDESVVAARKLTAEAIGNLQCFDDHSFLEELTEDMLSRRK